MPIAQQTDTMPRKALPEPPPTKVFDDVPPPLPSRPQPGRGTAPPSLRQPPLPPPPANDSNAVYSEATDDNYVEPGQPTPPPVSGLRPPLPPVQQEVYEEVTGEGPGEQDEEYDEFEVKAPKPSPPLITDDTYEIGTDDGPQEYEEMNEQPKPPPSRTVPLPPTIQTIPTSRNPPYPKSPKESPALPERPTPEKKSVIASGVGIGVPGLCVSDIQNLKKNLKSVDTKITKTQESKTYIDTDAQSAMEKFKKKDAKATEERRTSIGGGTPKSPGFKPNLPIRPEILSPKVPGKNGQSNGLSPSTRESLSDLPDPPSDFYDDGEIYDDALSEEQHELDKYPWFHGTLKRDVARDRIKKIGKDGTFLVRKSDSGGEAQPFTMMVLHNNHVYNLRIRKTNERYVLGEKKVDEITFKDVFELVTYHQKNDVILVKDGNQSRSLLKDIPVRTRF
ncbi:hypothetical protein ScPMuIL_000361 [Solemya velum]